jgi:tRNA(Ile)-lysidine synthase
MRNLVAATLTSLRRSATLPAGSRLGVAVSGGPDSVALLLLLLETCNDLGIVLSVVHLNHKLRGRASDADEKFVAQLAAKHGLDFHVERVDIAAQAKREKANLEDAARRARYDFFSRLIAENKVDRVATAHTADDQAETVLAHILRGTGLAGLAGIHPATESVIRPLLHVRRADLHTYLRSKKQTWREDATNRDTTRTRARIRKKLLPLLEKQFQPEVVRHLVSLAEFAREDEAFLDLLARQRCHALVAKTAGDTTRIAIDDLLSPLDNKILNVENAKPTEKTAEKSAGAQGTAALTKRMLRRLIEDRKSEGGPRADQDTAQITAQQIAAVLDKAEYGENGKVLQLPGHIRVRRERCDLVFFREMQHVATKKRGARKGAQEISEDYEHQIDFQNASVALALPQVGCVFRFRVIDWPANTGHTRQSGAVLDRDRLRFPLILRNWRPGDRFQPLGHQHAHKLKRLFNEKRISRWKRQGWPVLTSGGTLVWARGFPVAASFAATSETREAVSIAEESFDA